MHNRDKAAKLPVIDGPCKGQRMANTDDQFSFELSSTRSKTKEQVTYCLRRHPLLGLVWALTSNKTVTKLPITNRREAHMTDTPNTPSLADWQALYDDKAALVKSPEAQQFALNELAEALRAQGVITADELPDLIEQADAAYQRAVEEQLSAELNQPDVN